MIKLVSNVFILGIKFWVFDLEACSVNSNIDKKHYNSDKLYLFNNSPPLTLPLTPTSLQL